jgi:hypothetical protein
MFWFPLLLAFWRPSLRANARLARIYDIGLIGYSGVVAIGLWIYRGTLPLWVLIVVGAIPGLVLAFNAIQTLRTGRSFFEEMFSFLAPSTRTQPVIDESAWLKWINTRIPDPKQQQALMHALREIYVLQWRTFILFGFAMWLIGTACGGVVEWGVQKVLDSPFIKSPLNP